MPDPYAAERSSPEAPFLPYEVEVVTHDEETPPWVCGDCGYRENRSGTCDWCGQLWEMA